VKKRPRAHPHGQEAREDWERRGTTGTGWPRVPPQAALALVLLAALCLHFPALRLPFFADDYLFLDRVRDRSLPAALLSPDPIHNFWRPVGRQLYFWSVARLGESPLVAHLANLALFVVILALLFELVRRLAGARPALIGASFVALHYAADVPVRWASGSQDLIAVAAALGALLLLQSGRRAWASAALVLGLLAKETVVMAPLVAAALFRVPGEPWSRTLRRVWPLMAMVGAWAPVWIAVMHGRSGGTLTFSLDAVPAALSHLAQVSVGAEWSPAPASRLRTLPPLLPLSIALAAVALGWNGRVRAKEPAGFSAWRAGVAWAVLGALPVAAAASIWSAYYYLFALCGLSLAIGVVLARQRLVVALGVVSLLAWGSGYARRLEGFSTAPGNWNTQSHFNRFYFDRAMRWVSRYLEDLRRGHPTLPRRSTLFFAGIPVFAGWQIADGALVRWAHRDSTLRSYWLSAFSVDKARRGPVFIFYARSDSLTEAPEGPDRFLDLAAGEALSEHFAAARDALVIGREQNPGDPSFGYFMAWVDLALGNADEARRDLEGAGCVPRVGPAPELSDARRVLAAGDTLAAVQRLNDVIRAHALDPEVHALMAELVTAVEPRSSGGAMEALAARLLRPLDPLAWRRWAYIQIQSGQYQEAYVSLGRYVQLAGPSSMADRRAQRLLVILRQALPGGPLAQRALRDQPHASP